jgi:ABC-type Mn2+/Zn2+ transport system ATPase subunit
LLGRTTERDRSLVREAMEHMEVTHLADEPLRSLSGGQQQRIYLAQVMARDADLLVLDEPTGGLDVAGRERYRELVDMALARGAAVVTATHDIGEASGCDQVLLLNRRIVAQGAPRDVLNTSMLLETFGITLQGIQHDDHHDFVIGEMPHGHDHDHDHDHGHRDHGHDHHH